MSAATLTAATDHRNTPPSAAPRSRRGLRRVGAVLAGLVAIFVLSTGVDLVLHATGVFPAWGQTMSDGLFLLATAYRIVFSIAGCYLAARLAPDRPAAHARALGIVGVVISLGGVAAAWGGQLGPLWYPIGLVLVSLPCAWVGGRLRLAQLRGQA
jgi:hypothetical protein